jgi:hypothetical protein
MYKLSILVLVCVGSLGIAQGQTNKRSEIRIQVGPMLSKNAHFSIITAPPASMTLRPTNFNGGLLEFTYLNNFHSRLGWNASVGGGYTEYGFYTEVPNSFYGDSSKARIGNNSTSISNIAIASIGLHTVQKLGCRLELEAQMGFGAVYTFNKEAATRTLEWPSGDGQVPVGVNGIKTDAGIQPLMRGGLSIRYDSGAGTYILLGAEYLYTGMHIADGFVRFNAIAGTPQTGAEATYSKYFDSFRLQFGVGYRF